MKYLLDTCIVLFWLSAPEKLKKRINDVMEKEDLYISVCAIWEIMIKQNLGRIHTPHNFIDVLKAQRIQIVDIKTEHVLGTLDLPNIHRDPFDRLLIATAQFEDMVLVTSDQKIIKYPVQTMAA